MKTGAMIRRCSTLLVLPSSDENGCVVDGQSSRGGLMDRGITGISNLAPERDHTVPGVQVHRRRSIDPKSGHALEILGHAIEYLADEYVHEGASFSAADPGLEAMQTLMARSRAIYFACPEVPTILERIAGLLRRLSVPARS